MPEALKKSSYCQMAMAGTAVAWNDLCRGAKHWIEGPDEAAASIGLQPLLSGKKTEDEGLFVVQHKYWQDTMLRAAAKGA